MKRISALLVSAAVAGLAATALPAGAQYSNEYTPAKLIHQGKTTHSIAGSGTVVVQVQVNADGSHKAIRVIHSNNGGDNDAAMDIAQNSTYRPAHRGGNAIPAFYDFSLKFNGKSVVAPPSELSSTRLTPAAQRIAGMISAKQYSQAKTAAQMALLSAPGDDALRQMLGIAAYDSNDFATAASAFDKVPNVGKQFVPIAAASLATAAVQIAQSNPTQSLVYANKAVSLDPNGTNAKFALGVAQLANKQNAQALATLKAVHEAAMRDPKMGTNAKVNVDAQLVAAYLANNDTQDAQTVAAEIKQLDPNSTAASAVIGNSLLKAGVDAMKAKDNATALKDFEAAAAQGDAAIQVTAYTQSAFLIGQSDKPDYKKMQSYADKAVALKPDDALANFAEGVALTGQWAQNRSDEAAKKKAQDALTKADAAAKAAGNESLALQIESFMKQNLNAAPGGKSGGG
jgi:hypothetical protein